MSLSPRWQNSSLLSGIRVEWEWINLSQNLREDNKVSESKMGTFQDGWIHYHGQLQIELAASQSQSGVRVFLSESEMKITSFFECKMAVAESKMVELKMAAIIKLSQTMNKWSFLLFKMVESEMAEFKMSYIIKLSENQWVWFRLN